MRFYCQVCGAELELDYIGREELCPRCGAYLHSCIQCEFYDPFAHNQCREPSAEFVADKEKGNFCTYFKPKSTPPAGKTQKVDPDKLLKELLSKNEKKP